VKIFFALDRGLDRICMLTYIPRLPTLTNDSSSNSMRERGGKS